MQASLGTADRCLCNNQFVKTISRCRAMQSVKTCFRPRSSSAKAAARLEQNTRCREERSAAPKYRNRRCVRLGAAAREDTGRGGYEQYVNNRDEEDVCSVEEGVDVCLYPWFGSSIAAQEACLEEWERSGASHVAVDRSFNMWDASSVIGWYKYRRMLMRSSTRGGSAGGEGDTQEGEGEGEGCKRCVVSHCVSGGILTLYLRILAFGPDPIPQGCSRLLVLDSTPILPSPRSLARVALAFLSQVGSTDNAPPATSLRGRLWSLAENVICGAIDAFMRCSALALLLYHQLVVPIRMLTLSSLERAKLAPLSRWELFGIATVIRGSHDRLGRHLLRTVLLRGDWSRVVVINNPKDPYLGQADQDKLDRCLEGLQLGRNHIEKVQVGSKHADHIFAMKKTKLNEITMQGVL